MYKCNSCGAMFYETATIEEPEERVPSPFGMGTVRMGGGTHSCCPECESDDYEKMYFDGIHCPYCHEVIDLSGVVEDETQDYEFLCKNCKTEFFISKGEVEDVYQK